MNISIRITGASEAEALSQIQKAAFRPLYELFHDEGNPFLRGPEDILLRLKKAYRYFTILLDGKIVGGIFYRLHGKRSPEHKLGEGEYYLARVYVHPAYQNKGIARTAILLCEKEFADAKFYYVDFPEQMEKNRKCYQHAGYCDTGERIIQESMPTLAMYKKTVTGAFDPSGVSLPVIYEAEERELQACLNVIHQSFPAAANPFARAEENRLAPTDCLSSCSFDALREREWKMYALYAGKKIIGALSLSREKDDSFALHNLTVLPEYRHKDFGKMLLDYAKNVVKTAGGNAIKIYFDKENAALEDWCMTNGFANTGTGQSGHLPITGGCLEWKNE